MFQSHFFILSLCDVFIFLAVCSYSLCSPSVDLLEIKQVRSSSSSPVHRLADSYTLEDTHTHIHIHTYCTIVYTEASTSISTCIFVHLTSSSTIPLLFLTSTIVTGYDSIFLYFICCCCLCVVVCASTRRPTTAPIFFAAFALPLYVYSLHLSRIYTNTYLM